MDTALFLRCLNDSKKNLTNDEIHKNLLNSQLIKLIISDISSKPLPNIWKLIALSEIPFTNQITYTNNLIDYFNEKLFTGNVYSFDKNDDSMLTCYNAMITRSLIKLGCNGSNIEKSIAWIMDYQPMNREYKNKWKGSASKKYGGCFNNTPCYIGVVQYLRQLA